MGVVYYANYLVWFEVGRTDWLRETGWSYREMERDGIALPVIEAHCEYRQPARYDDEIEILTTGSLVTPVRIRFDYRVQRPGEQLHLRASGSEPRDGGQALALGYTTHAAVDTAGKPCRLPTQVRQLLPTFAKATAKEG